MHVILGIKGGILKQGNTVITGHVLGDQLVAYSNRPDFVCKWNYVVIREWECVDKAQL